MLKEEYYLKKIILQYILNNNSLNYYK